MDAIRIQSFKDILALCGVVRVAVELEGHAFAASTKSGTLHGMPVWTYSNGVTLFETERPEAHARETLSSYLDQVACVAAILQTPSVLRADILQDPSRIGSLEAHDMPEGAYTQWRTAFREDAQRSKAVLEERCEETRAFIVCSKCKSNAVDTEQKQTRSADEPMTIFCQCRNCGKRFTMT